IANSTTMNSGGRLHVYNGGTANYTKVNSSGYLVVDSGGIHSGYLQIDEGAKVYANAGATIDFTVSEQGNRNNALVNRYDLITGTPAFTITVSTHEQVGNYTLAEYASSFNEMVTVKTTADEVLGTLTVSGELVYDDITYSLTLVDDALVLNIFTPDTTPPTITNITANATSPTNGVVYVSADFADDRELSTALYRIDDGEWCSYDGPVAMEDNGIVYFKAIDTMGNVTQAQYEVTNIDTIAPEAPVATADVTEPTNGIVTVTAVFSDDSVLRQYRIGNGQWQEYVSGVGLASNGTVWFRGGDAAGNWSEEVPCTVTNIDTVLPDTPIVTADTTDITWRPVSLEAEFPEDAVSQEWRLDGGIWNEYTGALVLGENGLAEFRATDEAGNVSVAQYNVTNIVTPQEFVHREFAGDIGFNGNLQDEFALDVALSGLFTLDGNFGRLNGTVDIMSGKKKVASGKLKNGVLTFNSGKAALLESGNYTMVVKNSDKGKSASQYAFALNGQTLFTKGDNSDDWGDLKTKGAKGAVGTVGTLNSETKTVVTDWVGFGDAIDYKAFKLDSAATLVFDIASTDAVKFAVYSLQSSKGTAGTTYSLKSLATVTPKANKAKTQYTASSKALLLDKGTYYISVQSTNAAKGGSADYSVSLCTKSDFFTQGNNSDDTWNTANLPEFDGEWNDWAGFGDAIDYRALTLESASRVSFGLQATDATKFTVWSVDAKGKLKSVQATTLKANKTKTQYTATTKDLMLDAGKYYISMESTNAKKGGNAEYSVAFGGSYEEFPKGDHSNDTWKAAANNGALAIGDAAAGWVGFGDTIDFHQFQVGASGKLNLTFDEETAAAVNAKQVKLSCLDASGKTVSLAAFKNGCVDSSKALVAGTYYLGVTCANAQKYDTSYSVKLGMLA
ncbi:MAG: AIDA repeat-containing protein, partial [Victivallales bacterium]|nr:AIDA repeat-containing protein [Victivallales bacterium]